MSSPLHFQYLPVVIIQRIIFYTCHVSFNDRFMLEDREDVAKKIQKNSLALAHTCKAWGAIMLGLMYHKCELYTDLEYYLVSSSRRIMYSEFFNSVPNPKGIAHVRDLSIIASIQNIASGTTKAFLQSTNLGNLHFPSVTTLSIVLNQPYTAYSECIDMLENTEEFIEYICHLVPNPISINIHVTRYIYASYTDDYYGLLINLTHSLCTEAQKVSWTLGVNCFIPPCTFRDLPSTLTTMYCYVTESSNDMFRLIRMSSRALESLKLYLSGENTLTLLVMDEEGTYTRYPYLGELCVIGHVAANLEARVSFPDAAPFPQLHSLLISGPYPFSDDVLFRDNVKTLKVLECAFDYETVSMLSSPTYRKAIVLLRLDKLYIRQFDQDMNHNERCALEFSTFVRDIGYGVKKLEIRHLDAAKLIMQKIEPTQDDKWGENIRDLILEGMNLDFLQVIDLLKALPRLERLTSGFAENEELSESLEGSSFLDQIHKEYYLAFPNFRIWLVMADEADNVEFSAICSMLLALACSGFHGIRLHRENVAEYRETLKILTSLYPYKRYPWLSRRLLPGLGWRRVAVE